MKKLSANERNSQPWILYPAKVFFRNKEKIETYSDERKLRELITNRHSLNEWLEEISKHKITNKRKNSETSKSKKIR